MSEKMLAEEEIISKLPRNYEDARRIVACVNACSELTNDELDFATKDDGIKVFLTGLLTDAKSLKAERDQLQAANARLVEAAESASNLLEMINVASMSKRTRNLIIDADSFLGEALAAAKEGQK